MPVFPRPDLSNIPLVRRRDHPDDAVDTACAEGVLADGRPYVLREKASDSWRELVFYLPAAGLQNWDEWDFALWFERQGILRFVRRPTLARAAPEVQRELDAKGEALVVLRYLVKYEAEVYISEHPPLHGY